MSKIAWRMSVSVLFTLSFMQASGDAHSTMRCTRSQHFQQQWAQYAKATTLLSYGTMLYIHNADGGSSHGGVVVMNNCLRGAIVSYVVLANIWSLYKEASCLQSRSISEGFALKNFIRGVETGCFTMRYSSTVVCALGMGPVAIDIVDCVTQKKQSFFQVLCNSAPRLAGLAAGAAIEYWLLSPSKKE
jgi:hypothetical protein